MRFRLHICCVLFFAVLLSCAVFAADYVVYIRPDALCLLGESTDAEPIPYAEGYYTTDSPEKFAAMADAGMAIIAEDAPLQLLSDTPLSNDPYVSLQWYLDFLGASAAWEAGLTGKGVTAAFIDSGISKNHEDFCYANISGYNFLGTEGTRDVTAYDDDIGHGTLGAGILAAQVNNSRGTAGLVPDVSVLALRFSSSVGGSANAGSGSISAAISAIGYAIEQGADVLNMSFGGTAKATLSVMEPELQKAAESGMLLIASAGNSDTKNAVLYPAGFDCVIGVGYLNTAGTVHSDSHRNGSIFVTAPGESIYGPYKGGTASYKAQNGSSFAAPIVSALGVMAKQADPAIGMEAFESLLRETAIDAGESGWDSAYGFGKINIEAFVTVLTGPRTVTYETNGGAIRSPAYSASYYIGKGGSVRLPDAVSKKDSVFTGWYLSEDCTGTPVCGIAPGTVGAVTLYAGFRPYDPATDPDLALDADGDGAVTVADILYSLQALLSGREADLNGDGKTGLADILYLQKQLCQ